MGKGTIMAGGNVISKFIENANVTAGGYVHSEAILHSNVIAKGEVTVTGKKGFITGGVVRTPATVSCKTIGSTMGVTTEIEVGTDPKLKLKANSLTAEIAEARKKVELAEPVILTFSQKLKAGEKLRPEQIIYFKQASQAYKELKANLDAKVEEMNELMETLDESNAGESCVKVEGIAYPGTKITISETTTTLTTAAQHSRFVKDGADVRIRGL